MRQISAAEERTFSHAVRRSVRHTLSCGSSSGETPERIGAASSGRASVSSSIPGSGTSEAASALPGQTASASTSSIKAAAPQWRGASG